MSGYIKVITAVLWLSLVMISLQVGQVWPVGAAEQKNTQKKKKFVYKSHTQIDLTGETVQGKIRSPEVFYIFQRKRSEAHSVVKAPDSLFHQSQLIQAALLKGVPQ